MEPKRYFRSHSDCISLAKLFLSFVLFFSILMALSDPCHSFDKDDFSMEAVTDKAFGVQAKYRYDVGLRRTRAFGKNLIVINIKSVELTVPKGEKSLAYLSVGLGRKTEKGWTVTHESGRHVIDRKLGKNETLIIRDVELLIEISSLITNLSGDLFGEDVNDGWLVFTIGLKNRGRIYAHGKINSDK